MNNKRLGNSFEQELAQIFYKHGFWVHCFASKAAGQPVDLIACKNDVGVILDAKVCSDDVFDTARMEENQRNSMMLFDYCGIALIAKLGCKALWLTHTKDLLKQSEDRAAQYFDRSLFGEITEGKVNIGKGITFATVQTLATQNLNLYRDSFDCIIVDECHRVAGTPTAATQFGKVIGSLNARYKYGLSATVHRADGLIIEMFSYLGMANPLSNTRPYSTRILRI